MRSPVRAALPTAALCAALVSACGAGESTTPSPPAQGDSTARPASLGGECQKVGHTTSGVLRVCFDSGAGDGHGQFIVGRGAEARVLPVQPPGPTPTAAAAGRAGHWAWAALSPDGDTILAQWTAECEVPIAFFVDVAGGAPTPVTGEDDWATSPESVALGWTKDGRAIVFLPKGPACGAGLAEAGIHLYSAVGSGELLIPAKGSRSPLEPSVKPRSVAQIRQAAA
jgi:hypothetical protein